jgi:hypothetical protein
MDFSRPFLPELMDLRSIYGHIDFLGKGSTSLLEDVTVYPWARFP